MPKKDMPTPPVPLIIKRLKEKYRDSVCSLHYKNPYELLIATVLSAQTTDAQVNKVTTKLFKRFPSPCDLGNASLREISEIIKSIGLYKNKTKYLKRIGEKLCARNGKVPLSMKELLEFPGVGRKTANVVLGEIRGYPDGVVVDTHMKRIANRLRLSQESDPKKIEADLSKVIPQREWTWFSHAIIDFGREICTARNPQCTICPLNEICPNAFNVLNTKKNVKNKT